MPPSAEQLDRAIEDARLQRAAPGLEVEIVGILRERPLHELERRRRVILAFVEPGELLEERGIVGILLEVRGETTDLGVDLVGGVRKALAPLEIGGPFFVFR